MNKDRLRSVMVLNGDTYKTLSEKLGIAERSLCSKVNENGSEFTQKEITKIKGMYNLQDSELVAIFFSQDVSCKTQAEG